MIKKFIYICSPLRGDIEGNINRARSYCRSIAEAFPDVVPIAPHIYCTQFLDDTNPNERSLGMDMGLALLDICDEIWVYGDKRSEGMLREIEHAKNKGIPTFDGKEKFKIEKLAAMRKEDGRFVSLPEQELGDAFLWFPPQSDNYSEAEIIKSTAVRISGSTVLEIANHLKRHRGQDVDVHMEATL